MATSAIAAAAAAAVVVVVVVAAIAVVVAAIGVITNSTADYKRHYNDGSGIRGLP